MDVIQESFLRIVFPEEGEERLSTWRCGLAEVAPLLWRSFRIRAPTVVLHQCDKSNWESDFMTCLAFDLVKVWSLSNPTVWPPLIGWKWHCTLEPFPLVTLNLGQARCLFGFAHLQIWWQRTPLTLSGGTRLFSHCPLPGKFLNKKYLTYTWYR